MAQHEAYQGLARKWRPQRFEDLVGQEGMTTALQNALRQNRLNHAHLLTGPRGIGKTTSARIIARALNCEQGPTPSPCGVCRHCIDTANGSDLDVIEIDAASNTGVEQMRDLLERVVQSPFSARFKVYIIDEVHMLSTASFNALLKTLEEPPPHVIFIFATTEFEKVPETVRSRCVVHALRRLTAEDIIRRLTQVCEGEGVAIEPAVAREVFALIARAVEGGMRDALVIFDQLLALTDGKPTPEAAIQLLGLADHTSLAQAVGWLATGEAAPLLQLIEELVDRGRSLERFIKSLIAYLRDLMLLQAGAGTQFVALTGDALAAARKQSGEIAPATLFNILHQIFELEQKLTTSTQARFLVEFTFLRLAAIQPVVPIDDVLKRIMALPEGAIESGGGAGRGQGGEVGAAGASARPASAPLPPLVRREAEPEPAARGVVEPVPMKTASAEPQREAPGQGPVAPSAPPATPVSAQPAVRQSQPGAASAAGRPAASLVDIFSTRRAPAIDDNEPAQAVMFDSAAGAPGNASRAADPLLDLSTGELRGQLLSLMSDSERDEVGWVLRVAELVATPTTLRISLNEPLEPGLEPTLTQALNEALARTGGPHREAVIEIADPELAAEPEPVRNFYEDDATTATSPEEFVDPRDFIHRQPRSTPADAHDPRDRRSPSQQVKALLEQPELHRRIRMIKDMFSGRFIDDQGREVSV